MDVVELFCKLDDFCQEFEPEITKHLIANNHKVRVRQGQLSLSEMMTIVVLFHRFGYRNFKNFYGFVKTCLKIYFPQLVSYQRFVELMPKLLLPLTLFVHYQRGRCTGISYIDSTKISVCKNIRISRNKVFANIAKRGRSSMGWFFGFKLHLLVNDRGEIMAFQITTGNVDDRKPAESMTRGAWGKLFGDRGYISQKLFKKLKEKGLCLITSLRGKMKNKLISMHDKMLLRKRYIIETINDQLKNIFQIEHSRHRSPINCMVNIVAGLVAYNFQDKKPSIKWSEAVNMQILD